jgi:flagellar protein FlaG
MSVDHLEVHAMARIDATIATQLADANRPPQTQRDALVQSQEARRQDTEKSEPTSAQSANPDELRAATERLQRVIETATGRQLDFTLNDRFKELVVRISDRKSGEVIKEFPSKEFMKLRERLNDLIGMFIDEKA